MLPQISITKSPLVALILTVACLHMSPIVAHSAMIALTDVQAFPNERTINFVPDPNAIDGILSTYTWSTQSGTTAPVRLAISFDSTDVNRIRLWKDDADGAGSVIVNAKDLTIQYTTDIDADLSLRTWTTVTGLTSGFESTEFINATTVNSFGTVIADVHDSVNNAEGWASLMFDEIEATGIAILVEHTGANTGPLHYKVHEFEAHFNPPPVPEPSSFLLLGLGALGLMRHTRRRRRTA